MLSRAKWVGKSGYAVLLCMFLVGCANLGREGGGAGVNGLVVSAGWQLQDIAKVPESGEVLSNPGYSAANWYKATVPGTVLTSLVNEGVYPEPLYGENNRPDKIPESLCRTSYWYRTELTIPAGFNGKHVWLNFDGINYIADIWANGRRLGEIRGAFSRGVFDITSIAGAGERVAIAVLIKPPPNPGEPQEQTVALGMGGNGGVMSHDGPTFISSQGWDWIPAIRDRNMGIWQNVTLTSTGPVVIQDPYVVTDLPLPQTDRAEVMIEAKVRNVSGEKQTGVLRGTLGDHRIESGLLVLSPGESTLTKFKVSIDRPKLWWPNGLGDPYLYPLELRFQVGSVVSDTERLNVGIREVSYSIAGSDNLGLVVNGVPVFAKGGNWGMDEAMKRSPRERLEAQIRLHREANYTIIRNWVGQSTSEDFYDLCDRYGILVWDEFFQPNPSDSGRARGGNGDDDIADIPMYLANVREKVLRFRNHPSIALWCGRNEGVPTPAAINEGNAAILKELNPDRLYQPSSTDGRGVRSGGPYAWRTPEAFYAGPARGGRGRGRGPASGPASAPASTPLEPFKTEIGSASIPTLESIKSFLDPKDWNPVPLNDAWAAHDLCRGNGQGDQYPARVTARYGAFTDLPSFVRKAQLMNYEAHRAMYEGRQAKMFNPSNAVINWMSNPAQPSFTWQVYSYDLEPFGSFFGTQKACEPVHIQMNQDDWRVMVINNTARDLVGLTATVRVVNMDGSEKKQRSLPAVAKSSSANDLGPIEFPADVSDVHFVKLELRDSNNRIISHNFYWRGKAQQADFTAMDSMPTVGLNASASYRVEKGKCLVEVTLSNPTKQVALMAHAQLRREESNQRVLPVYYSENYVSLLAGEQRTIRIEASVDDLKGEKPMVVVDGWNVVVAEDGSRSMRVKTNDDAIIRR